MATSFRQNIDKDRSGTLEPKASEVACTCPKCGSPYLAVAKAGDELTGFKCSAGDCKFSGKAVATRD